MAAHGETGAVATTVVVSYSPSTDRVQRELTRGSYRGYLRKVRGGAVEAGDEWEEFVNCGCGTSQDVDLRVERVEGGDRVGENTEFEFVAREDGQG